MGDTFSFAQMEMPLPHIEPRVAPKLFKALEHNTVVKRLEMANCNMQKPEGNTLAESLRYNGTIETINIEANCLSPENMKNIAVALREAGSGKDHVGTSKVTEWKFTCQRGVSTFGSLVDKEVASLADGNWSIRKLGVAITDADCRNRTDKALMRNNDWARRAAKAKKSVQEIQNERKRDSAGYVPVSTHHETYTMRELRFQGDKLPKPAFEVFNDEDPKQSLCRTYVGEKKMMPTRETFQQFAKTQGVAVSYGQVAGVIKDFNDAVVGALVGTQIYVKGLAPEHVARCKVVFQKTIAPPSKCNQTKALV